MLAAHWYSYRWSDGWVASIEVLECTSAEARFIRRRSLGFNGYDWMIDSILARGCILADHEIEKVTQQPEAVT